MNALGASFLEPNGSQTTDRQKLDMLMRQTAARDRLAFRALYDATRAKLYGIILRILPERDVASDILQEVYVKIWEKAADFDAGRASPITWMATIARNRALDEVRRVRPVMVSEDEAPEQSILDDTDPLASRERSEELTRLLACLGGLEAEKREMVLLAYYRGLSREALSKRFNRPVPTVKTLLYRSLSQLRECLGHG